MTANPNELVQAKRVQLWLGTIGSSIPADLSDPGTGFFNVGHTNPESCRFRVTPEFEPVFSQQSDFPIKIVQTATAAGMDVDLLQWNGNNIKAVFGGGTIEEAGGGLYKYTPPTFGNRTEVIALLDVIDGTKKYRFVAARTFNQSEVELTLNKSPESRLPLRLTILGSDSVDAWYLLTNDAAFAP